MELNEEADQSDQESQNLGVGRSYECVFCKRGFTTAQALGGHMNIHRKDRAKNKPSSSKHEEDNHSGPRFYQPILSSYPQHYYAPPSEAQLSYRTFFPAISSSSTAAEFYGNYHDDDDDKQHLDHSYGDNWRISSNFQYDPAEDMNKRAPGEGRDQNDLDLELRLVANLHGSSPFTRHRRNINGGQNGIKVELEVQKPHGNC